MNLEEAAQEQAEIEIDFIKLYFENLSEHQLKVLQVALNSAYRSGYLHGSKETNEIMK